MRRISKRDRDKAQALLSVADKLQQLLWDTLSDIEDLIDCGVNANQELNLITVEDLIHIGAPR